ncbi:unnamed protein product [Agarophyton chilense]
MWVGACAARNVQKFVQQFVSHEKLTKQSYCHEEFAESRNAQACQTRQPVEVSNLALKLGCQPDALSIPDLYLFFFATPNVFVAEWTSSQHPSPRIEPTNLLAHRAHQLALKLGYQPDALSTPTYISSFSRLTSRFPPAGLFIAIFIALLRVVRSLVTSRNAHLFLTDTGLRYRKRARTSALEKEELSFSDVDATRVDDCPTRPPQAERKRELERNRRNLVNIRFVELEKELIRSGPRATDHSERGSASSSEFVAKGKRIDKEAVLKEAAQRIAALRKEVESQASRIASMTDEISHLRAEKLELRTDKSYLRNELENARNETKRLRADNIGLWQALRKQSVVKNYLAPDLAKIPVDLFTRKQQSMASSITPSASNAPFLQGIQQTQPPQSALPSASQPQQAIYPSSSISATRPRPPAPDSSHETNPPMLRGEAILMHQTSEELSDLFATYIPGVSVLTSADRAPVPNLGPLPDLSQSTSLPVSHLQNPQLQLTQLMSSTQSNQNHSIVSPSIKDQHSMQANNSNSPDISSSGREKSNEDPLSDIAFCV